MKNTKNKSGIYVFIYKNKYCYIGQSSDIHVRIESHKKDIFLKRHPNLSLFDDYKENDFTFNILEHCDNSVLNEREIHYHDLYEKSYISLNKRKCGLQGHPDFEKKINDGTDCSIKILSGHFYIGEHKIAKFGKLHSLFDLSEFISRNSNFKIRISDILNRKECLESIGALKQMEIKGDTINKLKEINAYKVVGARDTKKAYCDYDVFITILHYCCPQISASLVMYITDMIFKIK